MVCSLPIPTMSPFSIPFWDEVWRKLRPRAIAAVIDFGLYTRLWLLLLGEHIVRIAVAASGFDPETIRYVAWMEKWTFLSLFAGFFIRIFMGLVNDLRQAK